VNRTEKGYTLVELLVTLAVSGIIFTVIGGVIFQLSTVSGAGNDRLTANHSLQNAAYWFNLDGQSAQNATGGDQLALTAPDAGTIVYSLAGHNLLRTAGNWATTLAQDVSKVNFTVRGRLVSMDITASPSGRANISVEQNYTVYLRPVQ
jgi:prepilin-type N-terminal cleavage/methylation domain-containing protein